MLTRRSISTGAGLFTVAIAAGGLMACASGNTASGNTSSVPTLAQVQAYVGVLNTELPAFLQESITSGLIKGPAVTQAQTGVATFQALAAQVLAPSFNVSNATQIITQLSVGLTTVLSVIPATAPYIGFIQLAMLVITGFIAGAQVSAPASPPSSAVLATMHRDTVRFGK